MKHRDACLRLRKFPPAATAASIPAPALETAAEAIALLDRHFPWPIGAEKAGSSGEFVGEFTSEFGGHEPFGHTGPRSVHSCDPANRGREEENQENDDDDGTFSVDRNRTQIPNQSGGG